MFAGRKVGKQPSTGRVKCIMVHSDVSPRAIYEEWTVPRREVQQTRQEQADERFTVGWRCKAGTACPRKRQPPVCEWNGCGSCVCVLRPSTHTTRTTALHASASLSVGQACASLQVPPRHLPPIHLTSATQPSKHSLSLRKPTTISCLPTFGERRNLALSALETI